MSLTIRVLPLVICFFTAVFSFAQPNTPAQDQASLFEKRGKEAFLAGRFQESIDHFSQAIQLKPGYMALTYRGNAYLILKNYSSAEKDLARAIDYYLRSGVYRAPQKGFQMGPMLVIQPGQTEEISLAMIYNNRGIARYFQGNGQEAIEDFNSALEIDPGLQTAIQNRNAARLGLGLPNTPSTGSTTSNPEWRNEYNRLSRPVSVPSPRDPQASLTASEDLRELRAIIVNDEGGSRGLFGPRVPQEFSGRTIPKKGKFYRSPGLKAKSQSYIFIENIKITDQSTFVRLRVENQEEKDFLVSLEGKGSPGAFYLTDRSGSQRSIYNLKRIVEGISTYPKTTSLKPGVPLYITLEFEKIPDTLGYINMIEGSKENGQAWNFYQVDLTK